MFAGTGRGLSGISDQEDACQSFIRRYGNPQRVTQSRKQAKEGVRGKSPEVLFDSFSAEKQFVRKRRLDGKMRPLPGGLIVFRVPHHSVKPGGRLNPRAYVGIRFEPDANAAGGFLLGERLQRYLQQFFARGALQSRARHASPARFFLRLFPPNCHSMALSLLASSQVHKAAAQDRQSEAGEPVLSPCIGGPIEECPLASINQSFRGEGGRPNAAGNSMSRLCAAFFPE